MHWEECGHPDKGSSCPSGLSTSLATSGVVCPSWGSPFWRNGEELPRGQRNYVKIGLGVLCGEAERPGLL